MEPASQSAAPLRRVGVLGDVHAEDVALDAALHFFAHQSLDAVLCVGDIVDGPGDAERTVALLMEHDVVCVRGNHERWFAGGHARSLPDATPAGTLSGGAKAFLASLPATRTLDTVAGAALLCHGLGRDDMARLDDDTRGYALACCTELWSVHAARDVAWMIGGHTHRRMVRRFDHLTVLNAGTLYRAHDPCLMMVDFEALEASFYDLDGDRAPALATRNTLRP